ncbi:calcium:proton antiporter [Foetidibacter luteolus]|uniref:calcium:proton antiporter n=1 Tax=Foetidibacter luteolus TaxID=2608880 RepID=UPI00129B9D9A|nr:ionic transporter y4hA [Foetidibacter luteolus]
MKLLLKWTTIIPIAAWVLYFSGLITEGSIYQVAAAALLILSVIAAVHHSEIIAHRVGEPYGTIILAVAVTIIEVSIIISLMVAGGPEAESLARDTIFSAIMLILNGITGLCLFLGGLKYKEQSFSQHSATIALVSLVAIIILTLIFPSYTTSVKGPYYSTPQLIFVAIACLTIYSFFLLAQTKRHREYFLSGEDDSETHAIKVSNASLVSSLVFLLLGLGIVVLLAKTLSPTIEKIVISNNLPKTLVGVIIAAVILLPEGIAAIIAAKNNKLQTSLNLALGSALASIGLTIPCVAVVSSMLNINVILGLDVKSTILLALSVFTVMLSLARGRTNMVYGVVLLVNLMAFIFLIVYP